LHLTSNCISYRLPHLFFGCLRLEACEAIALKCFDALEHDLLHLIANNSHAFPYFHETDAPYRAKLFKLASTTQWIVYRIDVATKTVDFCGLGTPKGRHQRTGFGPSEGRDRAEQLKKWRALRDSNS
jgi:hypothetical protein